MFTLFSFHWYVPPETEAVSVTPPEHIEVLPEAEMLGSGVEFKLTKKGLVPTTIGLKGLLEQAM